MGALVLSVAFALRAPSAYAEVGRAHRPISFITLGPSCAMGLDGALRFGGEVALAQYAGGWGLGGVVGFVPGRIYFEVQPAMIFGERLHNIVLGLNPGFVIDVTSTTPRYGGQATLWGNYVHSGARSWASPLVPFVRVEAVMAAGMVFTGGLMLKIPIPIS